MKVVAVKKGDKGKEMKGDGKSDKRAHPKGTPPSFPSRKKTLVAKKEPFTMASTLFEAPPLDSA